MDHHQQIHYDHEFYPLYCEVDKLMAESKSQDKKVKQRRLTVTSHPINSLERQRRSSAKRQSIYLPDQIIFQPCFHYVDVQSLQKESAVETPPTKQQEQSPYLDTRTQAPACQKSTSPDKKRVNSWTQREEAFLIGIVVSKYLSKGSLFSNVSRRKRKRASTTLNLLQSPYKSTSSNAIQDCWISIKKAFDVAWRRYTDFSGLQRSCERTSQALARHYKVMKTKLKAGGQTSFHSLYSLWQTKYNTNNCLLEVDFFLREEREQRIRSSNGHSYQPLAGVSAAENEGGNDWTEEEEVLLVGIVVDRFIKRGSLVSSRSSSSSSTDSDCWSSIKRNYDKAWTRYQERFGVSRPIERSVNVLCRHFKILKRRYERAYNEELDIGLNAVTVSRLGDLYRNSLSYHYDLWQNFYNTDNILLEHVEY